MNDEILARIDAEWQRFLPSLNGLTEERASQPGVAGYYSVKDLIAHLAWWEDQTREVVETGVDEPLDVEATNDRIYSEFKDARFADLKEAMISGHERAIATFAAAPNLTEDDVESDTWEHYEEHGDEIRAWRTANGI